MRLMHSDYCEPGKKKEFGYRFFSYLGTTVRTPRNDFLGRLSSVEDAVTAGARFAENQAYAKIAELHVFIMNKFESIIGHIRRSR